MVKTTNYQALQYHDAAPGYLDHCQITGSKNLFEAIDLGHQPPCDALLNSKTINEPESSYPLKLMICPDSGLAQLDYVVEGEIIYPADYPYRAGISQPLIEYQQAFADSVVEKLNIPKESLCVDIGSNDGTLLTGFRRRGMKVLGVEPTNIAKVAKAENQIDTIQRFFTEEVARNIVSEYGQAKVATMSNVFAHMAPLGEVMRGLVKLLDQDGVFISESQYLLDVLESNQFDGIYHEHIRNYSFKSLVTLFPYYGMEVFDVQRANRYGGNIRIYAGFKGERPIKPSVPELLSLEEEKGLFKPETWVQWKKRVEENRYKFMELAYEAKRKGQKFVADSCPGRGAVLFNYYGIDHNLVPYISQLPGSEKIGQYLPGTHIPIVDNEIILKDQPDYIVILAWHYGDYIMKNWRAKGVKSKFVVPLPEFKVISD
ncbi:MAG: class I SAM-dependent methyltransferase [Candidatus Komeilibacteria bacterium CG10_big_fil_rev_8_21_14_0_10_41_13]|uniref:Class I SAM-dependent methyltransferase n=1 Tax=Candidatus Komeilibacteria bacterium CG10_big_fil_rev_8_21_14_0_10_41_13 TaxID=1974476 RepID=A0A2M6WDC1_9BACT|nr:MAG: class I SAM-dependent methyltransferase [Candidatus Komeilibacteria bacterium CG10_big_fil_rev_8_21_14_0_10_41_13]